jgi:hypothetical protein
VSIWSSVGATVKALDGHGEAANYGAEGEPSLEVDVATARSFHDHIRLAIFSEHAAAGHLGTGRVDVCALLSPDAAHELVKKLMFAIAHAGTAP